MSQRIVFALLVAAGALAPGTAAGQRPVELSFADPQPHFVAAWAPKKAREAERSAVLVQRVSLELAAVSLNDALKALINEAKLNITYSPAVLPPGRRVTIKAGDIAVVTALTEMLFRSGLDVVVDRDGALALVRCRHPAPRAEARDSGTIVGTVTDKATGAPIAGATITVERTKQSATTNGEGQYRIEGVDAGTHTLRARYIGYTALAVQVVVPEGGEVSADLSLVKSTQKLDELVTVTPGGMQTQLKAVPTPVTVITAEDIERQRPATLASVFRQAVPSGVSPEFVDQPAAVRFSARGASSLSGLGVMKVLVDGVEASTFELSAVDPASVERIEVIRGPQAATVYGADAVGGVVQITTKRGDADLRRAQVEAQALVGMVQTPYTGFGRVFRQQYSAVVRGSRPEVSYNLGVSYTGVGDRLPDGEISEQSSPSAYAGVRYSEGIIAADLHARYSRNNLPFVLNPEFLRVGLVSFSRPRFTPGIYTNETYGTRISVATTPWWHNQLTLGADRFQQDERQAKRRFTTPDDTLFSIADTERRKVSLFFNSSAKSTLGADLAGSLTAGFDYYRLDATSFFTANALRTQGTIETDPPGAFTEGRATVTNSGYFAQAEANWQEQVFLTAGLRAERNSTFGAEISIPVSPRFGLSVVRQIGTTTVKLRGAWGRAIRTPPPGAAFGESGQILTVLPNIRLQPEQQQGWDTGIDLVFGQRGSFSVTGFTQTATNLIAFLQLPNESVPTFQFQNVGRVTNRGVEVEGTLSLGPGQLKGQYGYVRSRVEELGPGASDGAEVQPGDQPLGAPTHTAGASLTTAPWEGAALTVGATYVGGFRQTDFIALFRCFGNTGPCQETQRGYVIRYPALTKLNLSATQQITPQLTAILSVDNLTNNSNFEGGNTVTVNGRTTMVGVRARL